MSADGEVKEYSLWTTFSKELSYDGFMIGRISENIFYYLSKENWKLTFVKDRSKSSNEKRLIEKFKLGTKKASEVFSEEKINSELEK